MNVWKLVSPNRLEQMTEEAPQLQEGKLKIRITKVMLNKIDAAIFGGAFKISYPLIPGRFAVGRVAESSVADFKVGARVLLHTHINEVDTGTAPKDFSLDDYTVCGQTTDGFFRDFIVVDPEDVTVIPQTVSDNDALLVEIVALAKAVLEALDASKGQHIAIIGGDLLGIVLGKLLIYQQVSPLLIDNYTSRLQFAKECGIYYTTFADDTMMENVGRITGGRLADGAIFVTSAGTKDKSLPFKVLSNRKRAIYTGFHGYDFSVDLELALRKQISVYGVTNGAREISTAVNLLANKAIDLSSFSFIPFEANEAQAKLAELAASDVEADSRRLMIAELV